MTPKIPVTVLTGFLGSGKTTLLNRILSEDHGMRIAVIENEFGEIGIDQDLVINADEEVFEMNNGCICCNVRGDLIRILGELADRRDQFDRVILETTGMADPGPVAQTFLVQEDVQEFYELDGVITLVDGKHVGQHLDDKTDEVLAQVAFADRIIINKGDLTTEQEKLALKKRLQSMNTMAGFYFATMADAPIAELLDIGGFNVERAVDIKPSFLEPEYPFESGALWQLPAGAHAVQLSGDTHDHHDHEHHDHDHEHHDHDHEHHDHDHDHEHHDHEHSHGDDSSMSILMSHVTADDNPNLDALAEQVFVEFSATPAILKNGQTLDKTNTHYQMTLEGSDVYEFPFSLKTEQSIALFMGHRPKGLRLKLLGADGHEISAVSKQSFHGDHSHDTAVSSTSIELPGKFNGEQLNTWLEEFLIENGPDVYRMKGVVGIAGQDYKFVFQGVHMIFGSQAAGEWGDEEPLNRLVFIGKNLDKPYIKKSLEACLA